MNVKFTILALTIMVITLTTAWPTLLSFRHSQKVVLPSDNLPDAFMEEVTAIILDKAGKPKIKLITPHLTHFSKDDSTQLIDPHLTLYRNSPEPWHITSKFAKASQGVENLNFWDNVIIQHLSDKKNPNTIIKTTRLNVYPNKHTAQTAELITMTQPNLTVKAIGMFADIDSGDIRLLSHARGEYVPDS